MNGADTRADWTVRCALIGGIVGALVVLFHLQGNSTAVDAYGHSAIGWMTSLWRYEKYDFSHGWLIPLVSLFFIWRRRAELRTLRPSVYAPAALVVAGALVLHIVGVRIQQTRLSLLALMALLWSIPTFFVGKPLGKVLLFPCVYLVFCIPFTFLDGFSFKLRLAGACIASDLLNGVGIETMRNGTALFSRVGDGFSLEVADPCSGLKYFIALTSLTAAYAYFAQRTLLKQWLLFISAVPIAIAGNVVRIFGIAVVASLWGQDAATGLYHDYSGLIVFTAAILLMMGVQALLNVDYVARLHRWRKG